MHVQDRYVLDIRETLTALVVRRVQKNTFLWRSRFVSCVHTQVYMTTCLFVLIVCLHVTYTNKNLDNNRVTTFLTHSSSWRVRTFLKQDGVSKDPEMFSYVMKIYERACAYTKTSQIDTHDGPGRTWKCSVCEVGYESVLSKHIQMLTLANPTGMVIQQWSTQSVRRHHRGGVGHPSCFFLLGKC
jgi:hypothetical protein